MRGSQTGKSGYLLQAVALGLLALLLIVCGSLAQAEAKKDEKDKQPELKVVCPEPRPATPPINRSEVYGKVPFKAGEEAKYELKYGALKVLVGYGYLKVATPINHPIIVGRNGSEAVTEKRWHMVLQAEAFTGDWYQMIFRGRDKIQAVSRPWDFGISKFYMSQDEEKPFVRHFHSEKWFDFEHYDCNVKIREVDHRKKTEKNATFDLMFGATDALGAVFRLRTFDYQLNKPEKFIVYTSEKNWELRATPVAMEKVKVNAGEFDTVKLALTTYLGQELQQRGEVYVWVATSHPSRPIVKVEGEVTFGSVYLLLDSFKAGE